MTAWYTSVEVCELLGCTRGRLNHLVKRMGGVSVVGSSRIFTAEDLAVLKELDRQVAKMPQRGRRRD